MVESGGRVVIEPIGGRLFEDGVADEGNLVLEVIEEALEALCVGAVGFLLHGSGGIFQGIGAEVTRDPFDAMGGFLNLGTIVVGEGVLEFLQFGGKVFEEGAQEAAGDIFVLDEREHALELERLGSIGRRIPGGWIIAGRGILVRQPALEDLVQAGAIEGFGNKIIHARTQAALAVTGHGMGGHGDDGDGIQPEVLADAAGGFDTIHTRHLNIHKDEGIGFGLKGLECLGAVGGMVDRQAELAKPCGGDLAIDRIVLDEENVCVGRGFYRCFEWEGSLWAALGRFCWSSYSGEGFGEVAAIDRFDQRRPEERFLVLSNPLQSGMGGKKLNEGKILQAGIGLEGFGEVAAGHIGHGLINEDHIGNGVGGTAVKVAEGIGAGGEEEDLGPPCLKRGGEGVAATGIVIDNHDLGVLEIRNNFSGRIRGGLEGNMKGEL